MGSPYDLVGPVLPQALRLARCQALINLPEDLSGLPTENDTINQKATREEERILAANASVVVALEDLFSQRNDYAILERHLKASWKNQRSFLEHFTTQELVQIHDWNGMYLFADPHIVLRCYEEATSAPLPTDYISDDGPYTKVLTQALSELLQQRNADQLIGFVGPILDDINGEDDRCKVKNVTGLALRDWEHLKGLLELEYIIPTNLDRNLVEMPYFEELKKGDWSKVMRRIFACRRDKYLQWSTEDWVCDSCWIMLLSDTMCQWALEKKKRGNSS
ncbi:hypothetical protein BU15DRAFT_59980 [Melanogaster broomeanus]|nr:hypothetical protein BU15DRAFT_59980 [Melanogaster broomeanus]